MNSRTLIAIVVIALVVLGGYFLISSQAATPTEAPETSEQTESTSPTDDSGEFASVITYTDGGFSPDTLTASVGDTVRFTNNSSRGMWVGADDHPTHTSYDGTATREHCANGAATGGAFDMCRQASPGESWEFTFTKAGTFEYHNHAQASHGGAVTVVE